MNFIINELVVHEKQMIYENIANKRLFKQTVEVASAVLEGKRYINMSCFPWDVATVVDPLIQSLPFKGF